MGNDIPRSPLQFSDDAAVAWAKLQARDIQHALAIDRSMPVLEPCLDLGPHALAGPVLCICSLIRVRGRNLLLIPGMQSGSCRGAFGRTTVILSLLGLRVAYTALLSS